MANIKTGFAFYRVDTDRYQDIRIKRLKKTFGCAGIAVYDFVLCLIYRDKGCFLEWGESTAFDVAEYFDLKESTVNEIVRYCGAVGLFDKALLSNGIITSLAIQTRYRQMCRASKRSEMIIPEECKIIPEVCDKSIKSIEREIYKEKENNPPPHTPPPCVRKEEGGQREIKEIITPSAQSSPPPQATTAPRKEEDGKKKRKNNLECLQSMVDEKDYWEALRLSSYGSDEETTHYILEWATHGRDRGEPFYEVIQALQRMENNGTLVSKYPDRLLWRAQVYVHLSDSLSQEQKREILSLSSRHPEEFISTINEWHDNKNKIKMPHRFILSRISH